MRQKGGEMMHELIREYGRGIVSAVTGVFVVGLLIYACRCIASYMAFFADLLMG